MQIQFNFEEMRVIGDGLMAEGHAILEDAGEGYEGEFIVIEIVLKGGYTLPNPQAVRPLSFDADVSCAIRKIIEDDRTPMGSAAALEWADVMKGDTPAYKAKVYGTMDLVSQGLVRGAQL